MKKNSSKIDWLKFMALLISLAGLLSGGFSYLLTRQFEARQPYLEMQLDLYKRTAHLVSVIATYKSNDPFRNKAIKEFNALRWGELNLVTDGCVAKLISRYKDSLGEDSAFLRSEAYCLENEMRISLANSWNIQGWNVDQGFTQQSCSDQIDMLRKLEEKYGVVCGITRTGK